MLSIKVQRLLPHSQQPLNQRLTVYPWFEMAGRCRGQDSVAKHTIQDLTTQSICLISPK